MVSALAERQMKLAGYLMAGAPSLGLEAYPLSSACASVGNATQENLCRPVTPGKKDHGSDGLFQWRLDRLTDLKIWCSQNKLVWNTIEAQALFFLYEMKKDYPSLHEEMIAGVRPLETLTANICKFFERPAAAEYTEVVNGRTRLEWRMQFAHDALALMQGSPTKGHIMSWLSPLLPNQNQVTSGVRWALSASTAFLASKGWIGADTVDSIVGLTPLVASGVWSWIAHSQTGTIAAASAIPAVQNVVVSPTIAKSSAFKDDNKVVAPMASGSTDFASLAGR